MNPDAPVTKDLIARGFGRDVMGLLLAYRELDLEKMFHPCKIEHVLRLLGKMDAIIPCQRCPAVTFDVGGLEDYGDGVTGCPWCKCALCAKCRGMDIRAGRVICGECAVKWCPECGSDGCVATDTCMGCKSPICDDETMCSRCWIADKIHGYGSPTDFASLFEYERMHVKAVAERLGIKDDDRIFESN